MKISVIIPCYNEEKFIGQAIGSLLEQSRLPEEIIVVDDGSYDSSTEIARRFGGAVKVLSSGGGGAPKARNLGAEYASGDALMFFDADDVLGPYVLQSMTEELKKNPDSIVACPWFRLEKVEGRWIKKSRSCPPLVSEQDYLSGWITGRYHPPCSVLWSRSAYNKTGGWDPDVTVNQDGDLMMRALVEGVELRITNKGAAYYRRMPEDTLSSSQSAGRFTRKGRQSQILVLTKIAKKLDEKNKLDAYREPITDALNEIRTLCQDRYPELAEECTDLINKYGELRYVRFVRNSFGTFICSIQSLSNIASHNLTRLGLDEVRKFISHLKNIFSSQSSSERKLPESEEKEREEITFGLEADQEVNPIKNTEL